MKVTIAHRSKTQQAEQLIDLSCRTHLSRINKNTHDVKYLVTQICKRNNLAYGIPLGSICAHVAKHYSADIMKRSYADVYVCQKIINKFRNIFMPIEAQHQERALDGLEKLARYGRMCLVFTMKPQFKESITNLKLFDQQLISIIKRLLSSLLLEYVPSQHSPLLLKLYLQDFQTEQERFWMQDNRMKHEDIYPFHDFFQVLCSLSYHILNTRKAINWKHYLEILANPCVGSVEWPMVLGVRNLHKLPYPQF